LFFLFRDLHDRDSLKRRKGLRSLIVGIVFCQHQ
jgi:hypothetical protein